MFDDIAGYILAAIFIVFFVSQIMRRTNHDLS